MIDHLPLASAALHVGGFKWTGDFTTVDLIAASTNSLNGALLARRPDHYKNWTVVGILLCALLMGLGGGITRDVLVGQVPSALTNPARFPLPEDRATEAMAADIPITYVPLRNTFFLTLGAALLESECLRAIEEQGVPPATLTAALFVAASV